METAIYVSSNNIDCDLGNSYAGRLYIGEEFCDTCFISIHKKLMLLLEKLHLKAKFSVVLPVVNEKSICFVKQFVNDIMMYYGNHFEIICNDIGMLNYLMTMKYPHIVSGRFLTRFLMGYFISDQSDKYEYFFKHIGRVEIDGLNSKYIHSLNRFKVSYYLNYRALGLANNRCPYRMLTDQFPERKMCTFGCDTERLVLQNKYLNGSYTFFRNVILEKDANDVVPLQADRVVHFSQV